MSENFLKIGEYVFPVTKSTFRFVENDGAGNPGWEFNVQTGKTVSKLAADDDHLNGMPVRFYAEGDPIPIPNKEDLLGVEIFLESPYDEESGEVYFTLYVFEHGELTNLSLKFVERKENLYRMLVTAKVPAGTATGEDENLTIDTWIKRLPKTGYGKG